MVQSQRIRSLSAYFSGLRIYIYIYTIYVASAIHVYFLFYNYKKLVSALFFKHTKLIMCRTIKSCETIPLGSFLCLLLSCSIQISPYCPSTSCLVGICSIFEKYMCLKNEYLRPRQSKERTTMDMHLFENGSSRELFGR